VVVNFIGRRLVWGYLYVKKIVLGKDAHGTPRGDINSRPSISAIMPVLRKLDVVTPGFLKNKIRLIICVPRKSTHMSEWKSIRNNVII
jgi:hypothetical protein